MQPFSCHDREQHIFHTGLGNFSRVLEIHISRLEPQRWSPEFVISFSKSIYLELGIKVWLISFGVMLSKSQLDR
jgi:hypothetical protein